MRVLKRFLSVLLITTMMFSFAAPTASAAKKRAPSLNKTSVSVYEGNSTTLKVTGASKKVKWSSSAKSVATVSSAGKVTGKKAGKTTITAKTGNKVLKCTVTVKKVTISKTKLTLKCGTSANLKLNGTKINSVKSSNKKVATVAKSGKVSAKQPGTATITLVGANKKEYKCKVTVNGYIDPTSLVLMVGETSTVKLYGGTIISAQSSNPEVASVSSTGAITAHKSGIATISIISSDKKLYQCIVAVYNESQCTVNFESNGGSIIPSQILDYGNKLELPESPTREGYSFDGWYTDKSYKNKFDSSVPITQNMTLYAKWKAEEEDYGNPLTREEWIAKLAEKIDLHESSETQHLFDDYDLADNPSLIDAAIQSGIVPVSPDEDNIVYFRPKDPASREFTAYTSIQALKMKAADDLPDCNDRESLLFQEQDLLAVKIGMLKLINNKFLPDRALTTSEAQKTLSVIQTTLASTEIRTDNQDTVDIAPGVEETENVEFETNEQSNTVTLERKNSDAENWQPGEIHILRDPDHPENDIAIKVVNVQQKNGDISVKYETPKLDEVVTSFDVEGKTSQEGTFTPAEGVTVLDGDGLQTQATAGGTIELFGKQKLAFEDNEVEIDMKNLEYRFSASPSWHILTINEVYLCLNTSVEASVDISGSEHELKVKLGDFNVPVGYGFNVSGEIYFIASAEGKVSLSWTIDNKTGIQYTKAGGFRAIHDTTVNGPELKLEAGAKAGIELEPGAEFLGIDLVSVGTDVGLAFDGELSNMNAERGEFCLDATGYLFLSLYAQIGWDDLNLRAEYEIMNKDHSVFRKNWHFEETGRVDECTRGNGKYTGLVLRADNNKPINQAKVQVFSGTNLKDTTYTDINGAFIGIELPAGEYIVRVSASGFQPYEQSFNIVGGSTTTLRTQLMISREEDMTRSYSCSGIISDSFNGERVDNALITVSSLELYKTQTVATTRTQSDGTFSVSLPAGNYQFVVSKDGYVTNTEYVSVTANKSDINITINPENQMTISGNLRAVLTWGSTPKDLDAHMIWEENTGDGYHVYWKHMEDGNMNLDIDNTEGDGRPETISVSSVANGMYHYYVHDYSNKFESSSTGLAKSGAKVTLYSGTKRLYTISVPTSSYGTLWHVFDYNPTTDRITLVNEFSYCEYPYEVGSDYLYTLEAQEQHEKHDEKEIVETTPESDSEAIEARHDDSMDSDLGNTDGNLSQEPCSDPADSAESVTETNDDYTSETLYKEREVSESSVIK